MAGERGLTCPWSQRSEVKPRSSFQALMPPFTSRLVKSGRKFPRMVLRTVQEAAWREDFRDGGLWPAAPGPCIGQPQASTSFPSTGGPVPGTQPTTQGNLTSFPSLPFPLKGSPPAPEISSQPSRPWPSCPISSCLLHSYLSQGGGRASWDPSPSPSRSSRRSSQVLSGMVAVAVA